MNILVWVFGQNCDLIFLDIGDIPYNFCGFILILVLNEMLLYLLDKSWS